MKYGPTPQRRLPEQDGQKIMLCAERYSRAAAPHSKWAETAKKCVDFFEGRQWTEKQIAEMMSKGRLPLKFNMIAPLVRLIIGYQRNNKTDIVLQPGDDGRSSEDVADVLTSLFKSIARSTDLEYTDVEVFMDGLLTGRGFYRTILDFEHNDLGETRTRAQDPFDVYIDPDADTYDLNESAGYLAISKYVSIDQIEDNYGQMVSELLRPYVHGKTPIAPVSSIIMGDEITPIRAFGQRDEVNYDWWDSFYATMGDFVDTARKTIRITEFEHHVVEERNVVVDLETGDKKVLPLHWDNNRVQKVMLWAEQQGNPLQLMRRKVKRVQWTTMCGDMLLYDRPSPYNTYTLTPYYPYFRRGITRGMVDDLIDPQLEKNKRRSVELEIVSKTSNGGWMYHEDSLTPQQKRNLKRNGSSPGLVLEFKGDRPPTRLDPGAPPMAHDRLEQKADQDLYKISGVNESALGQIDRVQSGRAIEARQRQAVIAVQMYMDNFRRSKHLLGNKWLDMVQNHYTEERMFRMMGEDGKIVTRYVNQMQQDPMIGTRRVLNDITVGKYVATIDEAPLSATFAEAQFEEMMTLLEKMGPTIAPFMPMFGDLIIDQSTLPRKQEWKERMDMIMQAQFGQSMGGQAQPAPPQGGMPPGQQPPNAPSLVQGTSPAGVVPAA